MTTEYTPRGFARICTPEKAAELLSSVKLEGNYSMCVCVADSKNGVMRDAFVMHNPRDVIVRLQRKMRRNRWNTVIDFVGFTHAYPDSQLLPVYQEVKRHYPNEHDYTRTEIKNGVAKNATGYVSGYIQEIDTLLADAITKAGIKPALMFAPPGIMPIDITSGKSSEFKITNTRSSDMDKFIRFGGILKLEAPVVEAPELTARHKLNLFITASVQNEYGLDGERYKGPYKNAFRAGWHGFFDAFGRAVSIDFQKRLDLNRKNSPNGEWDEKRKIDVIEDLGLMEEAYAFAYKHFIGHADTPQTKPVVNCNSLAAKVAQVDQAEQDVPVTSTSEVGKG